MSVKILIKRDSTSNFISSGFIPREDELVSAFETDTDSLVFKIGDGKTSWADLPEISQISELSRFKVYIRNGKEAVEVFLNPFEINSYLTTYST